MNHGFADPALDSFINVDIDWMPPLFYTGQSKPPEPSPWSKAPYWSNNTMNEGLEMDLLDIINAANKRSRMMAAPAINIGAMGSWDLLAGTMGSWKPELEMRPNAALLFDNLDATTVTTTVAPRSPSSLINENVPAAENTLVLPSEPAAAAAAAAEATGALCRGSGAAKVKKKRVRPSRRVPTTVVKTDTSNFKAMVQHYTGIPPAAITTAGESTATPSASSSSPESTSSASSPSSLPHPVLCKISNSSFSNPTTTASPAITICPSPQPASSFPTPELPFRSTVASLIDSHQIPSCAELEEEINIPLIDAAFIDKLWSY